MQLMRSLAGATTSPQMLMAGGEALQQRPAERRVYPVGVDSPCRQGSIVMTQALVNAWSWGASRTVLTAYLTSIFSQKLQTI